MRDGAGGKARRRAERWRRRCLGSSTRVFNISASQLFDSFGNLFFLSPAQNQSHPETARPLPVSSIGRRHGLGDFFQAVTAAVTCHRQTQLDGGRNSLLTNWPTGRSFAFRYVLTMQSFVFHDAVDQRGTFSGEGTKVGLTCRGNEDGHQVLPPPGQCHLLPPQTLFAGPQRLNHLNGLENKHRREKSSNCRQDRK